MKKFTVFLFGLLILISLSGVASGGQWPGPPFDENHSSPELIGFVEWLTTGAVQDNAYDATDDTGFQPFEDTLSGLYETTGLGWEAGYTNHFGTDKQGDLVTGNVDSTFGFVQYVDFMDDKIYFSDPDHQPKIYFTDASPDQVELWQLNIGVTITYLPKISPYYLPAGTLIAGFNDAFTDDNHDDLIVSLISVPEPTTILLLGSGLIGLAVFRKRSRKS